MEGLRRRTWLTAGVAALALAAVVAVPALATNHVFIDSKIKLSLKAPAFHGRVSSEHHDFCADQRTVKMFKQRPGHDKLLGKTETNKKGYWKVKVDPLSSGVYYAKVKRLATGAAGTIFVCRADKSNVAPVD